ncbi:MAG: type II CRISPR-associated endonuclease Cas1 [Candidatus Cloacimonadota bacterium]
MRILEIDKVGLSLSVQKGFLIVKSDEGEQKTPLDLIDVVIINSYGAMISNQALIRLCEQNIPLVLCGNNANPLGMLLSRNENVYRKQRITAQIEASKPFCKRLWQQVVSAKIRNQALVLANHQLQSNDLLLLAKKVGSGDPENLEAQAARIYWPRLFGKGFKRDQDQPGLNALLNYGYAILRAAFCRKIVASGLLPELGLHHRNQMNPYCLADDLMEPYRPFIDQKVKELSSGDSLEITPSLKRALISILDYRLVHEGTNQYLHNSIGLCVQSMVEAYGTKTQKITYPEFSAQWVQVDVADGDV